LEGPTRPDAVRTRAAAAVADLDLGRKAGSGIDYAAIIEAMLDAAVGIDANGEIVLFNSAAERLFGHSQDEALGADMAELLIPSPRRAGHRAGYHRLRSGRSTQFLGRRVEVEGMKRDGSVFAIELTVERIAQGSVEFVAFVRDLAERDRREQDLISLANDNSLILESAGDGIYRMGMDGLINYVNPAAAEILDCAADDLLGCNPHTLLHHHHEDGREYLRSESPITASLSGAVNHVNTEIFWRPNGTTFPVDYTSAPIREDGKITGAVCVFADISDQRERELHLLAKAEWTSTIHSAITEHRLELFAQPIVAAADGTVVMHELLVRMRDADGELLSPAAFLPQAEEFGLIGAIDRWVIAEGIRVARDLPVSINLSALSLTNPDVIGSIFEQFETSGTPPENVVFEITETAAIEHVESASGFIARLRAFGCGLALDDFGTGYGTFSHLRDLPATYLKIDIGFVRNLLESPENWHVVESIIAVAEKFGMKTIAEGVEDQETMECLETLGADFMQGYFLGRPAQLV
jgi:PAS domain S-box-containing protein